VGPERLSLLPRALVAVVLAALVVGCSGAGDKARPAVARGPGARHLQIVHAMTTPERRTLVDRLRERNPTPPESRWTVNEEALGTSIIVVDPFARFLRRARRQVAPRPPRAGGPIDQSQAADRARAFVKHNADLLGVPRHVVLGLAEQVREVEPGDHALPRARWAIRFEAPFASKGYEGFDEIGNVADVQVFVDDDGEVSSFVNLSRIHPPLLIDTRPGLAEEDPRIVAKLIGRRVFALVARDPAEAAHLNTAQELRRIPLGEVRAEDVTRMQLVIHVATGPQLAWLTYRLAYVVEVAKPAAGTRDEEELDLGSSVMTGAAPRFYFFRWVVDADTGDVLEDARVPLAAAPDGGA